MDWTNAECCAAPCTVALRIEPFGGFLDAKGPGLSVALSIEPEDEADELCLNGVDIESFLDLRAASFGFDDPVAEGAALHHSRSLASRIRAWRG
jgi:hypothetical protein